MTDLIRWLDGRRPAPPASLRDAMAEALDGRGEDGPVGDRLAEAGLDLLTDVAGAPSTRASAIRLLAADALITYACEAAVEEDAALRNGAVDRLTRRLDLQRFADILQRAEP